MKKQPHHALYAIGFVVNTVFALLIPFLLSACASILIDAKVLETVAKGVGHTVKTTSQVLNVLCLILLLVGITQIAGIVIAIIARNRMIKDRSKVAPHITFAVIGLFCQNAFYLIGGFLDFFTTHADAVAKKEAA